MALRDYLPDDYLVYYDIAVKGRHPDFVIVGPDLGLVVLEVKDWRLKAIAEVGAAGVRIRTADGERVVLNPIRQVRDYTLKTVDLLKQRPALRSGAGLRCGWGYGVLFPSLKSQDARTPSLFGPSLEEALEPGCVMTADDLAPEALLPRLRGLLPDWSKRLPQLDPAEIDEIRAVLHPEVRIGWGLSDADILRVMDREQERLARSLGDGHRLLRGVAGSGKTITLTCRAQYLRVAHPEWRVLVLCFNRVLADSLRDAIAATLVDEVLPQVPVRQRVLTLPYRLRYRLAWDHALCRAVLGVFARTLLAFYVRTARALGISDGQTGTVTVIQRFGSGLQLNVHFHTLVLDGVFSAARPGPLTFHPALTECSKEPWLRSHARENQAWPRGV